MVYGRDDSYTLAILVYNRPSVLMRVVALFSRRGYNIDSLSVGETEDPSRSRITIVVTGDRQIVEQIIRQVEKLVDVIKVYEMTRNGSLQRELVLVKIKADDATSSITQMEAVFGSLKNLVTQTASYWDGEAASRFRSMFREREKDVDGMLSRLKKQPAKLLEIAGIYVENETQVTEEHGRLPSNPLG